MAQRRPTPRGELIIWRHGLTEANDKGIMPGQMDFALTEHGRRTAGAAAESIALLHPRAVVSSDLARAKDTAAELCQRANLAVRCDPGLREVDLGLWTGLTRDQARDRFPAEYEAWRSGADVRRGGGETQAEAGRRAAQSIREALVAHTAGGPLVAVTHGGVARALVLTLLDIPLSYWTRLAPLGNCCWTVLGREASGWQLVAHNSRATGAASDRGATARE